MKKIFALLMTGALLVSTLAVPSFADEAKVAGAGGLDFYSMTIHYETPVVVDYEYVKKTDKYQMVDKNGNGIVDEDGKPVYLDKGYVFAEAKNTYVARVSEYIDNQELDYNEDVANAQGTIFASGIKCDDLGISNKELVYNKNFGIANIRDKSVINFNSSIGMYAVDRLYDDAGNRNPNFEYKDGYFIDAEGNKIDDNGFIVDANNLWHDSEGMRVEPFVEIDGKLQWIDVASRLDANGVVTDYTTITNAVLVSKGMITPPEDVALADKDFDESYDYNKDGKVFSETKKNIDKINDKNAHKALEKNKDAWLNRSDVLLYKVSFIDTNGDGKINDADLTGYNDSSRVFTEENIEVSIGQNNQETKVRATPVMGTPKTKAKITKITLEIDALGTSIPADVASDPQQKNEIYVTVGDLYENIVLANDYVSKNANTKYTKGSILGVAKSVTTKTEMKNEEGTPSTVKSVDVVLTEGVEIPVNANLYFNFKIQENQPEAAANFATKPGSNRPMSINAYKFDETKDVEIVPVEEKQDKGCGSIIGGSAAVISALAAVVLLKKKEER